MTKVKAIRKGCDLLTLYCNTGKAIFMNKGGLRGYGTVWIFPDRFANYAMSRRNTRLHMIVL